MFWAEWDSLERDAGGEHSLNERWSRHQTLQFEIEDPLERLHAERAQLRQLVEHTAKKLRLSLGVRVVGGMIAQTAD